MRSCVLLLALLGARPAHAQDATGTPPTSEQDSEEKTRARTLFQNGIEAYKKGRYKDAIDSFLEANRIYPNPVLSFNTARAYEKLGDSAGALSFYRDYLRRSPDAADKKDVDKRIGELEQTLRGKGVQQVTISSDPDGATAVIDGRPVGITPWTGEIVPGKHRLKVQREGYADSVTEFELAAHRARDVSVKLERAVDQAEGAVAAPEPEPLAPTTPPPAPVEAPRKSGGIGIVTWGLLGLGVAAAGGAVVFELLRADSEQAVRDEPTQVGRAERFDEMEQRQTVARVLAGVGGAALIAGGVLLVLDLSSNDSKPAEVGLTCAPGGCRAALGGRF